MAYLINKEFIGQDNEHYAEQFVKTLLGTDDAKLIYKNFNSERYDYPVLVSISFYANKYPDKDLLSVVNKNLENKKLNGFIKSKEDVINCSNKYNGPIKQLETVDGKKLCSSIYCKTFLIILIFCFRLKHHCRMISYIKCFERVF